MEPDTTVRLLQRRIDESGLSSTQFAESVLRREGRTIRRWLTLESPIPAVVVEFLEHPSPAPWPRGRVPLAQEVPPDPLAVTSMLDLLAKSLVVLHSGDKNQIDGMYHALAPSMIEQRLEGLSVSPTLMAKTFELAAQVRECLRVSPKGAHAALLRLQRLWQ
jgi:hypothetical protein